MLRLVAGRSVENGEGQHPAVPRGPIAVGVKVVGQVPVLLDGDERGEVYD